LGIHNQKKMRLRERPTKSEESHGEEGIYIRKKKSDLYYNRPARYLLLLKKTRLQREER